MKSLELINERIEDLESRLESANYLANGNPSEFGKTFIGDLSKHLDSCKQIKKDLERLQKQDDDIKSGELSDGYHTFNDLYYQRCILFATLVNQNKKISWKSYKHEDGELCFGGGWFIVGIDTPQGSYTYHYENKYWDLFQCKELECGKHWDGHTSKDVDRLLSIKNEDLEVLKILKEYLYEHPKSNDNVKIISMKDIFILKQYKSEELLKLKQWLEVNENE